jgi:hypothetical protein
VVRGAQSACLRLDREMLGVSGGIRSKAGYVDCISDGAFVD